MDVFTRRKSFVGLPLQGVGALVVAVFWKELAVADSIAECGDKKGLETQ